MKRRMGEQSVRALVGVLCGVSQAPKGENSGLELLQGGEEGGKETRLGWSWWWKHQLLFQRLLEWCTALLIPVICFLAPATKTFASKWD